MKHIIISIMSRKENCCTTYFTDKQSCGVISRHFLLSVTEREYRHDVSCDWIKYTLQILHQSLIALLLVQSTNQQFALIAIINVAEKMTDIIWQLIFAILVQTIFLFNDCCSNQARIVLKMFDNDMTLSVAKANNKNTVQNVIIKGRNYAVGHQQYILRTNVIRVYIFVSFLIISHFWFKLSRSTQNPCFEYNFFSPSFSIGRTYNYTKTSFYLYRFTYHYLYFGGHSIILLWQRNN